MISVSGGDIDLNPELSLAGLLILHKRRGSSAIGGHVFQLVTQPLSQVIQDAQLRRFIVQQRTAEMMYDFGPRGRYRLKPR